MIAEGGLSLPQDRLTSFMDNPKQ